MRWTDKPRKKTKREIVLEYIKFMKIMGYYPKLVSYMYSTARWKGYVSIYKRSYYEESSIVSHNQMMIGYFEDILVRCGTHLNEWVIREHFIQRPLGMHDYNKSWEISALLWSYFKDKHIDNCIIVD